MTNKCLHGFFSDATLLFKKKLWETPPKHPCFLSGPSFSLVPPGSRQQWSFLDVETSSKVLLPCTHHLSAPSLASFLGCTLFQSETAWATASPLRWVVQVYVLPYGIYASAYHNISGHITVCCRGVQRLLWAEQG